MTVTVKTNLPDFKRQMEAAGREFVKIARTATLAAARDIAKAVKAAAPKHSGTLKAAVKVVRARQNVPRGSVQYIVGIRQGRGAQNVTRKRKGQKVAVNLDAFYWRFLEQGWIPRGRAGALKGGKRSKALQRKRSATRRVQHPFIGPAFQSVQSRALGAFYAKLEEGVAKIK